MSVPSGSAELGARVAERFNNVEIPSPILRTLSFPNATVVRCGFKSARPLSVGVPKKYSLTLAEAEALLNAIDRDTTPPLLFNLMIVMLSMWMRYRKATWIFGRKVYSEFVV